MALLFFGGKRRTLQNAIAHEGLMRGIKLGLAEVAQRAGERIESLITIGSFDGAVVDVMAELGIDVERTSRLAPTLRAMHAEFGGGHVGDKQCIGVETVGREHAGA